MNIPMGYFKRPPLWPIMSHHQRWMGMQGQPLQPSNVSKAPGLSTGGKIALGALLFLFAKNLFNKNGGRLNTLTAKSVRVANRNWQPNHSGNNYAPSYYAPLKQSHRMRLVEDRKGNLYSEGLTDLANKMRQTRSLQEALDVQRTKGYTDWQVKNNTRDGRADDYLGKGRNHGVQSANGFDGFRKDDNGNPNKPRFVLMIGGKNKHGQFNEMSGTFQKEYGVNKQNVLYTNGTDKGSVQAGLAKLQQLSAQHPHSEIVTVIMPDHTDRIDGALYGKLDERVPEGGHTVKFWDGKASNSKNAMTETEYKDMENHYIGGKNRLTVFASCRAGAFVGDSIPPPR